MISSSWAPQGARKIELSLLVQLSFILENSTTFKNHLNQWKLQILQYDISQKMTKLQQDYIEHQKLEWRRISLKEGLSQWII